MIEYTVSVGVPQLALRITPTHRITIGYAKEIFTYWYVQDKSKVQPFDEANDLSLVELMFAKGQELSPGQAESLALGSNGIYRLQRINAHVFIITSMQ